jgi:hypothetical protein
VASPCNVIASTTDFNLDDNNIENDAALNAEVIYAGGGNAMILFRTPKQADDFIRQLSERVLVEAPDLRLVIAAQEFSRHSNLREAREKLMDQLDRQKRCPTLPAPLGGLGVTQMCRSTGLPAVDEVVLPTGESYPATAAIHAKVGAAKVTANTPSVADQRLQRQLPLPDPAYLYPSEFDELGSTKGEHSYIAVVHADGNDLGERLKHIGEGEDNCSYIRALRTFSQQVEQAGQDALKAVFNKLFDRIVREGGQIQHPKLPDLVVTLGWDKQGRRYFPFRPLVFGGDDVTFICDGRLGVTLAVEYLHQFQEKTRNLFGDQGVITACAGIAIVKTHYPFTRAYALAEELCQSAKDYRWRYNLGACLDWHFATGGLAGNIEEIRDREYKVRAGNLTLRPVTLDDTSQLVERERSWETVLKGIDAFQDPEKWAGKRNKVKALREALREGGEAVEGFLRRYELASLLDVIPSLTALPKRGWHGEQCGYFDAMEMADWYIPLE